MTVWKYGSYEHPAAEVNLAKMDIAYRHGPRGVRMERVDTIHLYGQFCEDTTAEVLTRIDELIQAYSFDYLDAGLYLDDGTLTRHKLVNSDSISGVRVIRRSWDGGPDELATTRTFDIVLQAVYPDAGESIIEWSETVETIGTCGPRFDIVETYNGPFAQLVAQSTAQRIIQSGSAVGYQGYVSFPAPLYPANEHVDRRSLRRGSGKARGRAATFFPCSWTYFFSLGSPQSPLPITR